MYTIIPLGGGKSDGAKPPQKKKKKPKPRVPQDARELARWRLSKNDGWEFAVLTGDFNPIHWIPMAAKAAGFRNTILHGFGTMARAIEGLNRALWADDTTQLSLIDVKFKRPLVLPARVGLYVDDAQNAYVGVAPGGPAFLEAAFETRGDC